MDGARIITCCVAIFTCWRLDQHEGRVKASLHIHVETREPRLLPIAKAHFPLYYANTNEMLASLAAFDTALQNGIMIVQREVLDRFLKN
jgi:hypothetical protein